VFRKLFRRKDPEQVTFVAKDELELAVVLAQVCEWHFVTFEVALAELVRQWSAGGVPGPQMAAWERGVREQYARLQAAGILPGPEAS
jgi:hypothetical protein